MTPWRWLKTGLGAYRFWTSRKLGRVLFPKITARREAKRAAKANQPKEQSRMAIPKHALTGGGLLVIGVGLAMNMLGIGECTPSEVAEAGAAAVTACPTPESVADRLVAASNEIVTLFGLLATLAGKVRSAHREKQAIAAAAAAAKQLVQQ